MTVRLMTLLVTFLGNAKHMLQFKNVTSLKKLHVKELATGCLPCKLVQSLGSSLLLRMGTGWLELATLLIVSLQQQCKQIWPAPLRSTLLLSQCGHYDA